MTIEEALSYHLLNNAGVVALAGDRGYPLVIPQDAVLPAYAYQKISGPRQYSHSGPSGLVRALFQITSQAESYGAAKGLINAIRVALEGYKGTMGGAGGVTVGGCFVVGEFDGYAQNTGGATVRMDFIIWHKE